jgi:ligand-binding sensor domain-containing protein
VDGKPARVEGARTGRVYALEAAPEEKLWIGAFNGLFAVEEGRVVQRGSEGVKGVLSLRAGGDTLWIGALRGLYRSRAGEIVAVPGEPTGWVGSLLEQGGTLWIGAQNGLFRLRGGRIERVETPGEGSSRPHSSRVSGVG